MTQQLEGKVALVTGAGAGIGRATAIRLAHAGATVVVSDINDDGGLETTRVIQDAAELAVFMRADVSQDRQVSELVQQVVERFGRLDCAVNNAGIEGPLRRLAEVTEAEYDRLMQVNAKGVWLCMKYELRQMLVQGRGAIVNMASVAGLLGAANLGIYAASKHAVIGMTRSAAVEYAGKGIRVNAVCPSFIHTAMFERGLAVMPGMEQMVLRTNPSHRLGTPDEVAEAVFWLCSDASSYTTGAALTVDGGLVVQ